MCCETPVSVGHVFARSMLGLRCPWTTLRLALKGSGGPDRRYGVLRARNAKTLLVDVFLYLTVVCWTSKKSLFSWRIPRAEFLIHFQDPSRAGTMLDQNDPSWTEPNACLVEEAHSEWKNSVWTNPDLPHRWQLRSQALLAEHRAKYSTILAEEGDPAAAVRAFPHQH